MQITWNYYSGAKMLSADFYIQPRKDVIDELVFFTLFVLSFDIKNNICKRINAILLQSAL